MMWRAFLAILSTKKVENIFRLLFQMKYQLSWRLSFLEIATIWFLKVAQILRSLVVKES